MLQSHGDINGWIAVIPLSCLLYTSSILSYLREKLQNDDVAMTIKIAEGNAIKKPLTSREIFDEMAKQNPSLQKLSDEFGLELS